MKLSPHYSAADLALLAGPIGTEFDRRHGPIFFDALLRHPNADLEVWRSVSARSRYWMSHESLADHPEASRDPVVRENIIRRGAWGALARLYPTATQAEFEALLPQMFKATYCSTMKLLERGLPEGVQITHELIERMAAHDHHRVRAAAAALKSGETRVWLCDPGCVVCNPEKVEASWRRVL